MSEPARPRWWPWSASRDRAAPACERGRLDAAGWLPGTAVPRAAAPAAEVHDPAWATWALARAGDEAAARRLVEQLGAPALALAQQLLGRREEAQDVVQEAFLRLWTSRLRDRGEARLSTCFHTIVINRCRSRLSARRETPLDPDELAPLHEAQALADAGDDPDETVPDARGLHAALAGLPVRQRMALVMWAWADADAAAIGDWLGIETNAAHQLLHRARRKLRERLTEAPGDEHAPCP